MPLWPPRPEAVERPAYRSLARIVTEAIATGELAPGDRLPTHRELAWQLGLSVQTVSRAYESLIRADILSGQVGRGTFVRETETDRGPPYARFDDSEAVIDCSMLTPATGPLHARLTAEALRRLSDDLPMSALTSFRPRVALGGFVDAMQAWLGRCGVEADADRIIPTSGATSAMTVALMTAAAPGDLVVTGALGHHALATLLRHMGVRVGALPLDTEGILPDALDRACRDEHVRALYAMPAGLGATAATMSAERRAEICEIARRHDILIVENDAWGPLEPRRPPPLVAMAPERVFYFTGLSKCLLPGLRLGALVAPGPFVEAAAAHHRATNWMASAILGEIGARWLRDGTAEMLLGWQRRALARRNRIAASALSGLDHVAAPHGLHLWLPLPPACEETDFLKQAMARGVAVAAGSVFSVGANGLAPKGVRICLGAPSERDLSRGLEAVGALARDALSPQSAPL